MKKIRENESTGAITHIYMKISQSISLCSFLFLKPKNVIVFLFYFTNSENSMVKHVLCVWGVFGCHQWEWRGCHGKGVAV
jgi:hypothetical protein